MNLLTSGFTSRYWGGGADCVMLRTFSTLDVKQAAKSCGENGVELGTMLRPKTASNVCQRRWSWVGGIGSRRGRKWWRQDAGLVMLRKKTYEIGCLYDLSRIPSRSFIIFPLSSYLLNLMDAHKDY